MSTLLRTGPRLSLITGVAGFCGSYLAEWLLQCGHQVAGIEIEGVDAANLAAIRDRIALYRVDIRDSEETNHLVTALEPDQIYHLAALTKIPGDGDYRALYETNMYGTINLLESMRSVRPDGSLLIAGSSAQYGPVPADQNPVHERQHFAPVTHYAVSKAAEDMLGYRYWAATGLRIVRTRAFNIVGPRQGPNFAASAFAKQVAEIECQVRRPVIDVGNLDSQRDFVDVRDVARAYWLALEHGEPGGVYNVCSGRARSIRSLLNGLLALSSARGIQIHQDPDRMQTADVPLQIGDYGRLHRQTGWQPEIPFEQTLRDLLDYWREQIQEKLG